MMNESILQKHPGASRQTKNLATISMICGIMSLVCVISVLFFSDAPDDLFIAETSVIAVTTGVMALLRIRKHPNLPGKGMAITGLVCGGAIALYILSFIIAVLVTGRLEGAID